MSQFLTDKYLKYRAALKGGPIAADFPCERCGYNLRGLRFGQVCPECGVPIVHRRSRELALHEMPLELIKSFRSSAWMASFAMVSMMVLALGGSTLIRYSAVSSLLVLALTVLWVVSIMRLTPALSQPQAVARGFGPGSRLRLAARWLQLAWLALVMPGTLSALTQAGPSPSLGAVAATITWFVGLIGVICLALLLARLAAWAGDDFAEKAFHASVYGSACGLAILLMIPFLAFLIGTFALVVGVLGLTVVMVSMMAFPVGMLALSRSVNWSVVHARERTDRSAALAARVRAGARRQQPQRTSDPIPLADPADPVSGETFP